MKLTSLYIVVSKTFQNINVYQLTVMTIHDLDDFAKLKYKVVDLL